MLELLNGLAPAWPQNSRAAFRACWDAFVPDMLGQYRPPLDAETDEAMLYGVGRLLIRGYFGVLGGYGVDVLARAWDLTIGHWRTTRYPLPALIKGHADRLIIPAEHHGAAVPGAGAIAFSALVAAGISITPAAYNSWLLDLVVERVEPGRVAVIRARSGFVGRRVQQDWGVALAQVLGVPRVDLIGPDGRAV